MVDRQALWGEMQAAQAAVVQHLAPDVQKAIAESIFHEVNGWFQLGLATVLRPEPLTLESIQVRNPYTKASVIEGHLQSLREADFLDENGVITQEAYDAYQGLVDVQDAVARKLNFADSDTLNAVNDLLERVNDEALKQNPPILTMSAKEPLKEDPVHRLYDLIARFAAFRDDAHLIAWQGLDLDAQSYEAFSLIWDGTADSAAKLREARVYRGYEESEWQAALDKLVADGWLTKEDNAYAATDSANEKREAIETETNRIFYSAFDVLSDDEVEQLLSNLDAIKVAFTPEPEAQ